MKLALRTSGGRGEYELAGRQAEVLSASLAGHAISYEIAPGLLAQGRCTMVVQGGKQRIRLATPRSDRHFHLLAADILLLPEPIRELRGTGHGALEVKDKAFSVFEAKLDVSRVGAHDVVFRPTALLLKNAGGASLTMPFAQRAAEVFRAWRWANKPDNATPLAALVRDHMDAVRRVPTDHQVVARAARRIRDSIGGAGDPLPEIARIGSLETDANEATEGGQAPGPEGFAEQDDTDRVTARLLSARAWRWQASRGYAARKFQGDVMRAYDARCLVAGVRLPSTSRIPIPGVEAAHILPWALFDINEVRNGLCLSRMCHWAFDVGLIRISFDRAADKYSVEVPSVLRNRCQEENLDVDPFLKLQGAVPIERLPPDRQDWPNPDYLDRLNQMLELD